MSAGAFGPDPYEVLGVSAIVGEDELRRAFRMRLRQTHPDHGGSASEFAAVQAAWQLVGTREARAEYDRGLRGPDRRSFAPAAPDARTSGRPRTRSSGHPGGLNRERYLAALGEWVGLGEPIVDPYDPKLVRSAPPPVRALLAGAIAEEWAAVALAELGMGFTVWHDVATARQRTVPRAEAGKIDHLVLGPSGLWAVRSEDWGGPVGVRRGEVTAAALQLGEHPVRELADRARAIERAARVRVSALLLCVPDGCVIGGASGVDAAVVVLGAHRGIPAVMVELPRLVDVIRTGLPGVTTGGTELFEVRSRLQSVVRFA